MNKYFRTKGTDFYFYDPANDIDGVIAAQCHTNLDGLGGARSQIDTSCMNDEDDTFVGGRGSPGQITMDVNYTEEDADDFHAKLEALRDSGADISMAIGFSNGTSAPTVDAATDELEFGTDRSGRSFVGYVSDVAFTFSDNDIVRTTVTVQRSGPTRRFKKTA